MEKVFVSSDELTIDALRLTKTVLQDGYQPTLIIPLWRGGALIGIVMDEALKQLGLDVNTLPLIVASYRGSEQQDTIRVTGLSLITQRLSSADRVLIVDDVYDTGKSAEHVKRLLRDAGEVRIATVYVKPANIATGAYPDYSMHETDCWVVFPHEIEEISEQELRTGKGEAFSNAWQELLQSQ